ncbi:MAG: STAS/SEC14 domain-containing protein [Chloroflexi bacterium]|nr:MAG: STAS/SEC14 domain-containing protein [Chloroflexota bacterium]
MSVMKLNVELSTRDLLRAVAQLPPGEMREFVREVLVLNARQTTAVLSEGEAQLLQKINRGLPPDIQTRMLELMEKRQQESLSPVEAVELQEISGRIEALNVERLTNLSALAQLRGVPLGQLKRELGLQATYA